LSRALVRMGLHRHRPDPDLSALLSFPHCRCGQMLWPQPGADGHPDGADAVAPADERARLPDDDHP